MVLWFGELSDIGLEVLVHVMMSMERVGKVPSQLWLLLVSLAKKGGGIRWIGLLSGFLRLWSSIRRNGCNKWEAAHSHTAFWGSHGKAADDAAWLQCFWVEWAKAKGMNCAGALLDLVKASEKVRHGVLVRCGNGTGFPAAVLRLCISIYQSPRFLSVSGACSGSISINASIVAGCGFATTMLKLVLWAATVEAAQAFPSCRLKVLVDDMSVIATGKAAQVATDLVGIIMLLLQRLEGDVQMVVSRAKTTLLASIGAIEKQVAKMLAGFRCSHTAVTLELTSHSKVRAVVRGTVASGRPLVNGQESGN